MNSTWTMMSTKGKNLILMKLEIKAIASIYNLHNNSISLDNCLTTSCYSIRSILLGHSEKRQKLVKPLPVITGRLHINNNISEINILLDSGASQSIVKHEIVPKLKLTNVEPTTWTTVAGNFSTSKETTIVFSLPMLHEKELLKL